MKTIATEELKLILEEHKKWLDSDANLRNADLRNADLRYADLSNADLRNADLSDADLSDVITNVYTTGIALACPATGNFTAYKKANNHLIKLEITADAKRSSATTRKCRCSKAKVLEIEGGLTEIASDYDADFIYRVGEIVEVKDFNEDRWSECSTGIHFFIDEEDARNY